MLSEFEAENYTDIHGNPSGGYAEARGIRIDWQKGPLGRDAERIEPNGAFVETVIAIAKNRIEFYQTASDGRFACEENASALAALTEALAHLNIRTSRREQRGVEGTHVA